MKMQKIRFATDTIEVQSQKNSISFILMTTLHRSSTNKIYTHWDRWEPPTKTKQKIHRILICFVPIEFLWWFSKASVKTKESFQSRVWSRCLVVIRTFISRVCVWCYAFRIRFSYFSLVLYFCCHYRRENLIFPLFDAQTHAHTQSTKLKIIIFVLLRFIFVLLLFWFALSFARMPPFIFPSLFVCVFTRPCRELLLAYFVVLHGRVVLYCVAFCTVVLLAVFCFTCFRRAERKNMINLIMYTIYFIRNRINPQLTQWACYPLNE